MYWFDDGGCFVTRLSAELGDIQHRINSLSWGGENSVFKRDNAAYRLAEHLSAEHNAHPQATQLVVAHSHGGNIALRALHYIQKRGGSLVDGEEIVTPLVVTLATPFIEIHQADVGVKQRSGLVRVAVFIAILTTLQIFASPPSVFDFEHPGRAFLAWAAGAFPFAILLIIFGYWIFRGVVRDRNR